RQISAGRLAALSFSSCLARFCAPRGTERVPIRRTRVALRMMVRCMRSLLASVREESLVVGGLIGFPCGILRGLNSVQLGIYPVCHQQFLVAPALDQFGIFEDQDGIGMANGIQMVRDHHGSLALH